MYLPVALEEHWPLPPALSTTAAAQCFSENIVQLYFPTVILYTVVLEALPSLPVTEGPSVLSEGSEAHGPF